MRSRVVKRACPALASTALVKQAKQGAEHLETGSFYLQRRTGVVDGVLGQLENRLQRMGDGGAFEQFVVELATQDGILIFQKDGGGAFQQATDRLGTQVFKTLLGVVQAIQAPAIDGVASQVGEQAFGVLVRHETESGSIFEIDDQVAGVIGDFDQKCERMAMPGNIWNSLD